MEYLEYNMDTGAITLEVSSGNQDKGEMQELLNKSFVDMSILKSGDVDTGGEEAGSEARRIQRCSPTGSSDSKMPSKRWPRLRAKVWGTMEQRPPTVRPTAETPPRVPSALKLGCPRHSLGQTANQGRKPSELKVAPNLQVTGGRGDPGIQ